jgi:hypothetical protein
VANHVSDHEGDRRVVDPEGVKPVAADLHAALGWPVDHV